MKRWSSQAGLTFPELLIVSFVMMTLLGLVSTTFRYQVGGHRREAAKGVTQTDVRLWLDRMVRDVREAGYDPRERNDTSVIFTITTLSPSEIRFTRDYDGDGTLDNDARESLGYRLNGGALQSLLTGGSWRTLFEGVDGFVLSCFDAQGSALTCASTPASVRRSISAIRIELTAHAETGGTPGVGAPSITQSAMVELRNEIL